MIIEFSSRLSRAELGSFGGPEAARRSVTIGSLDLVRSCLAYCGLVFKVMLAQGHRCKATVSALRPACLIRKRYGCKG